jgi:coproporphyrinogen III oxidase
MRKLLPKLIAVLLIISTESFLLPTSQRLNLSTRAATEQKEINVDSKSEQNLSELFDDFASFLQVKQSQIISEIEDIDGSDAKFCNDRWGMFADGASPSMKSGGITRVIQKGNVVEKGACSFTLLRGGKLTAERAAAIQGRQKNEHGPSIKVGDVYSAVALSMVLHTRSPMVPTFRSDVRIFMVEPSDGESGVLAWFGGGSDLTPYYLFDEDISFFHQRLKTLCEEHANDSEMIDYLSMKQACDEYFFLPARCEHRGTGGMFFDDMAATQSSMKFVKAVTDNWMPSWFPIIEKRQKMEYTEQQREWQLLRRGRYLEFNLLYDRGVKFGLANANPRVEGVMVSAPPLIAWEYNHEIQKGSEEDRLMQILKKPVDWVK